MKIMDKIKMRRNAMHCLFRTNVSDVTMTPIMPYRTSIMRILGHNFFYRKLKSNSMSIRRGNAEYIMAEKEHKRRH